VYVQPNIDECSHKHYRRVKALSIIWVCVCSISYPAFKAHAPYYSIICGMSGSAIFFHISI